MLYDVIMSDIKEAMKSKDINKRDVLKQVQSKTQADAKEKKIVISDEVVLNAIAKELKQLNQTKDSVASKPDSDLYKSTVEKISILQGYLPEQLSEDECLAEVGKLLNSTEDLPKGKRIGLIMKELKGKADNKLIKQCIDALLK